MLFWKNAIRFLTKINSRGNLCDAVAHERTKNKSANLHLLDKHFCQRGAQRAQRLLCGEETIILTNVFMRRKTMNKTVDGLKVVEVPYRNMKRVYYRREFDDYKLCGTYYKAGVPFEVVQASYDHENYPLAEGEFFDYVPNVFSEALGKLCGSIAEEAEKGFRDGKCVLMTGGGCEHAPGILGGIERAFGSGKKIGFIWMDAHGDFNTPETSESGRPGGMPLAVCAGEGCETWRWLSGMEKPVPTENIILADARNLDPAEEKAIDATKMTVVKTASFNELHVWKEKVQELADKVDMIYLHIDLDVLDGKYLPNSLFVEEGGPELDTVLDNIKVVMDTGKVIAFSLVSVTFVNGLPGQDIRTLNGMRILGTGLENWKKCPEIKTEYCKTCQELSRFKITKSVKE